MRRWRSLCQIAISVTDMERTVAFYENLGYTVSGGTSRLRGWLPSKLQNYTGVRGSLSWMVDSSPGLQLEFFQYENPPARPMPQDARPCDIGYRRMGVWVADFDAILSRLGAKAVPLLSEPREYPDGRRVCIRDPNGVFLEIMENDVGDSSIKQRSLCEDVVRTRTLSLSVPDLELAEQYFEGVLGMIREDTPLHTPEMEGMWGLDGAETRTRLLRCNDFILELVEYVSPRGRPRREDEHIGDAGIWHLALRFERSKDLKQTYRDTLGAGHYRYSRPLCLGIGTVVYMRTNQGFTLEYIHFPGWLSRFLGFGRPRN